MVDEVIRLSERDYESAEMMAAALRDLLNPKSLSNSTKAKIDRARMINLFYSKAIDNMIGRSSVFPTTTEMITKHFFLPQSHSSKAQRSSRLSTFYWGSYHFA